ncbi:MAG: FliH/SctL family protein [Verrucomicrobiota bacterium]
MNSSVNIVMPSLVERVSIAPDEKDEPSYQDGFAAGYEAGLLQAKYEMALEAQKQKQDVQTLITALNQILQNFEKLMMQHLPKLLLGCLERVFANMKLTDEDVVKEMEALFKDISKTETLKIEMSEAQLTRISNNLQTFAISMPDAAVEWAINASLKEGEFLLTSDMGQFDGRMNARIRKIQVALEPFSDV